MPENLKPGKTILGIIGALGVIAGIVFGISKFIDSKLGNCLKERENCIVNSNALQTQESGLSATLDQLAAKEGKPIIETVVVTSVVTVQVPFCDIDLCATPTPIPEVCNKDISNTPCLYMLKTGDTWQQIATDSPFGDYCRYPEILNINRNEDGTYPQLSGPDNAINTLILIPNPPSSGNQYPSQIRMEDGSLKDIPDCDSTGLPCIFTITKELGYFTYEQISQVVYSNNLFGASIEAINLEDCRRNIEISIGSKVVIPKRPTPSPE